MFSRGVDARGRPRATLEALVEAQRGDHLVQPRDVELARGPAQADQAVRSRRHRPVERLLG
eukprot:9932147-Alexandrium_andersonii.AAC.1